MTFTTTNPFPRFPSPPPSPWLKAPLPVGGTLFTKGLFDAGTPTPNVDGNFLVALDDLRDAVDAGEVSAVQWQAWSEAVKPKPVVIVGTSSEDLVKAFDELAKAFHARRASRRAGKSLALAAIGKFFGVDLAGKK